METYLIVDDRERSVIPFIDSEFKKTAYVVKRVTTADYLICGRNSQGTTIEEPSILAAIERKTLEDFAASFKDNRYENVEKMKSLRQATGCQLYFFVEGAAFPSPGRRIAGIPYANILAAMTKLMVRDNIFVVQTENEEHTAIRLAHFTQTFSTLPIKDIVAGNEQKTTVVETVEVQQQELVVPDILVARHEQSDSSAVTNMWMQLPGISLVFGKVLTGKFSIASLVLQTVSIEEINQIKSASGKSPGKDAIASLLAVRNNESEVAVKMLSAINGITKATAAIIIAAHSLKQLVELPIADLAAIEIKTEKRTTKFGPAKSKKLHALLTYSDK